MKFLTTILFILIIFIAIVYFGNTPENSNLKTCLKRTKFLPYSKTIFIPSNPASVSTKKPNININDRESGQANKQQKKKKDKKVHFDNKRVQRFVDSTGKIYDSVGHLNAHPGWWKKYKG